MIFRRLPASSSFVLAATRLWALQLDPGRATRRPGHLRGRSRRTVSPARTAGRSHRARSVRPLDSGGPYGCREEFAPCKTAAPTCPRPHAYLVTPVFPPSSAEKRPVQLLL